MADIELDPTSLSSRTFYVRNGDGTIVDFTGATVSITWQDPASDSAGTDTVTISTRRLVSARTSSTPR